MPKGGGECLIVIPVRYGSTRLPGKPLLKDSGKYLVQHVYERARRVKGAAAVLVATDDARIAAAVRSFGGEAVMTSASCATGTDRVAEAASSRKEPIVVNLQGDEPEIEPAVVEAVAGALKDDPGAPMATAVADLDDPADLERPQVVKVVLDARGRALYFSRAPIPFPRDAGTRPGYLRHVGIYAFRRAFLADFVKLPRGRLERIEQLEQLRALEAGFPIRAARVSYRGVNVDTPEDYSRFLARAQR